MRSAWFETIGLRPWDEVLVCTDDGHRIRIDALTVAKWLTADKPRVVDAIRRGSLAYKVDHDDAENIASLIYEELARADILPPHLARAPHLRDYVCRRLNGQADVYVLEADRSIRDLRHVVRHSLNGFEWGYGGSGPADLALSILCDLIPEHEAESLYQQFKWDVIARLPRAGAVISAADVLEWVERQRERRAKRLEESEIQQPGVEGGEPVE